MESPIINIRLGGKLIKELDTLLPKTTYHSRTEFIREKVRNGIQEEKQRLALQHLNKNFGMGRGTVITEEDVRKAKEKAFEALCKEKGIKL